MISEIMKTVYTETVGKYILNTLDKDDSEEDFKVNDNMITPLELIHNRKENNEHKNYNFKNDPLYLHYKLFNLKNEKLFHNKQFVIKSIDLLIQSKYIIYNKLIDKFEINYENFHFYNKEENLKIIIDILNSSDFKSNSIKYIIAKVLTDNEVNSLKNNIKKIFNQEKRFIVVKRNKNAMVNIDNNIMISDFFVQQNKYNNECNYLNNSSIAISFNK